MPKSLTVWITKNWKILKEMGIPDHLNCLLRNLYADQEATVRTEHGTADWYQIGKGVSQICILSPCLFNFYAEYIMQNARLDEAWAGIKTAGRNINNLRCGDDTTLMAEREEELKSFLMKVKEESEKVGLKPNIQKTKIVASSPISSVQFSSVQFSCTVVSNALRPHESQQARPPCPSPIPRVYSNSCPSSRWCHPTIHPLLSPSPPAPNPSQHQSLFQWVNSLHEVAKVLEFQLQSHHFMANRWRNNGNCERLCIFGLPNHCRWWLQPWN